MPFFLLLVVIFFFFFFLGSIGSPVTAKQGSNHVVPHRRLQHPTMFPTSAASLEVSSVPTDYYYPYPPDDWYYPDNWYYPEDDDKSTMIAAVVGGVVGGLLLVVAVVAFLWIRKKKKRRHHPSEPQDDLAPPRTNNTDPDEDWVPSVTAVSVTVPSAPPPEEDSVLYKDQCRTTTVDPAKRRDPSAIPFAVAVQVSNDY